MQALSKVVLAFALSLIVGGCGDDETTATATGIPCDVEAVLASNCWRCHGEPPAFNAPYQLLTIEQFQEIRGDKTVYERVVNAVDVDYMPPVGIEADPPVESLAAQDKTLLLDWARDGAPAMARETCE